ncbi:C-GCAxxG-C-C family protein [Halodesulfovibrio marinisediminis]|uniref:C_GCAxxG_C_C family probable redox protein n=1 Tax=Halodesulfovibrio marinisediminis DSM 17456 TaxID=1121457 RepID=A0A1N6I0N9_9BACT|nr:C-GCAxxG-C-C family protein [Halodesulfovibrio marinisediminis]SIO25551.1 C_GCAxxG_C_C family probable redox protein [Halodesulfovibrio marinisediminis DSM 17456]
MNSGISYAEQARHNALNGQTCSEAVMTAFSTLSNLDEATARKLASGMAGGMGGTKKNCGAVTAAYMILGLLLGPESVEDKNKRENVSKLVAEFSRRFNEQFGTADCAILTNGYNFTSPADMKRLRASGKPESIITGAAGLLEQILIEQGVLLAERENSTP